MVSPKRIQRKRTKGWRMPEGAVYVGRPTKWGNPFSHDDLSSARVVLPDNEDPVEMYRLHIGPFGLIEKDPEDWLEIRGRDLVCWCPLDAPCHADVLLEIANS